MRIIKVITPLPKQVCRIDRVFRNKIIVVTGTVPFLTRKKMKALIEGLGGEFRTSVSAKTNFLLVGKPGRFLESIKKKKAKTLHKPQWNVDEIWPYI